MENAGEVHQEMHPPGDRLSRLSEASLRINESLDLDAVLQGVLDSARSLTGATYSLITTLDETGVLQDFLVSGLTPDETRRLWEIPEGLMFFERLSNLTGPIRVGDFAGHVRTLGLPELRLPVTVSSFLAVPIRHQGVNVGNIHAARNEPGPAFSREDEETLVMFASQAALVIANARRHRAEQRARAGLETLIDTSTVGVIVFDARSGAPVSFNRETRQILETLRTPGGGVEQLLDILTFRRADGREVSLQEFPLLRALSAGETVRAEEIVIRVPDGRSVTTLVNATPIRPEDGEVESVVVTLQDMTPLEELERLRAEFLAMVSHELRMPLTSIRGSATTLLDASPDLDPAEMRQFHRIIVDQADNMRELIGGLLDVARIETGALPVDPEPVEVASLVDRARNTFQSGGGGNVLDIDITPGLPLVMTDRRRIVQVVSNLLSNAARHSPESSVIRVRAVRKGIGVEVSVADEGRGIPAEDLPSLFRKFSRIEGEGQREDTGLGLAICKGIVEAHGGRIWAESGGAGMGARFAFTLPAVEGAEPRSAHYPGPPQRDERTGERILVVDDDPETLRYVRNALSDAGYRPVVTADPGEALLLLAEERPRLALLDMVLPGSEGIELMGDILAVSDLPIIFLSVYGRDEVIAGALEAGATDYIVKPFSPTELVARVRAALRRYEGPYRAGPSGPYVLGGLAIDYAERRVTVGGRAAQLTPIEYALLVELSVEAGRVVPHDRLLRRVWDPGKPGNMRVLRTHLMRLRRKPGEDAGSPRYIFAEPGVGYRMPKEEGQDAVGP